MDDTQKRAAELLTAAADAGDRLVAVNNRTNELEAAAAQERATFIQELETYAALLDQAEKSSSLVRVTELDSRYGKLRTRLIQLHESDTARGRGADAAREEAEAIRAVVAEDQAKLDEFPASKASEEWARTLDRELAGADEIVAIADRAYTDTLAHLRALADKRRALRPYIDFQEQNADQATVTDSQRNCHSVQPRR